MQGGVTGLEKDILLKQQAIDLHKKEATKHALSFTELKSVHEVLLKEVPNHSLVSRKGPSRSTLQLQWSDYVA